MRSESGQPFYCAVLEGSCRLHADGQEPMVLEAGDFILIPSAYDFSMSSLEPSGPDDLVVAPDCLPNGEYRVGTVSGPADVRMIMGYCVFGSPDAGLLVSLLPQIVRVRGEARLTTLLQLVGDETHARRPARDIVLTRLLEVLFIEALRSTVETCATPGLLRGLADERVAIALRRMHEHPTQNWTVPQLATEAALSRSAGFCERARYK